MLFKQCLISIILSSIAFSGTAYATTELAAAETDTTKFVRLTTSLENDPFQDETKEIRTWLIGWAADSPNVTVVMCDILGPIPGQDAPNSSILLTQYMFGNAAYQIENPNKKSDELSLQMAGVRSLLRTYAAIIKLHPKETIPYFDDLLKKMNDGTLEQFMAPAVTNNCAKSPEA